MQASTDITTIKDHKTSFQLKHHCSVKAELSVDLLVPYNLDQQQEDTVSIDIIRLYQTLLPSKDSCERRARFVKKTEMLLNSEWPNCDIKPNVFGSSVNDLGTSFSDIDLCITTPWTGLQNIKVLANLFRRCGMQHVMCVPSAKVPIVRLLDPELQLSCDINVNSTLALENTKMIKAFVAIDFRVRPLIMVFKHWTRQRLLNNAANGGTLSSYTWTCMIINFLQQREPPILPTLDKTNYETTDGYHFCDDIKKWRGFGSKNKEKLGGLLYAFFRRFSIEFDYAHQVVSVRHGRYLTKEEKGWDTGRNKTGLCVEEPFNTSRNLGNSADVHSVIGLRCEFQRCLDLLLEGADLEALFLPYEPTNIDTLASPILSNSTDMVETVTPTHDRQKNTANEQYYYRHLQEYPVSHRQPVAGPLTTYSSFSPSHVATATINTRNSKYERHPSSPVPSSLIPKLNDNMGQYRSNESIEYPEYNGKYPNSRSTCDFYQRKPVDQHLPGLLPISNYTQHTIYPQERSIPPSRWSIKRQEDDKKKDAQFKMVGPPCSSFSQLSLFSSKPLVYTRTNNGNKRPSKNNSKPNNNLFQKQQKDIYKPRP